MLKNLVKSGDLAKTMPDLLTDLVKDIALLGKSAFNKQIGIEPIVQKIFIPLIPILIKETTSPALQLAAIKALGVFSSQACIIPIRMQNFYKDLVEQKIIHDLCLVIQSATSAQQAAGFPLQKAAIHVISVLINPYYGDTYSFPWKRGPHDNFNEYLEVLPVFDSVLRQTIYQSLCDFDFLSKFTLIFNAEDET